MDNRGFTLTELLAVLVIIAAVSAAGVTGIAAAESRGRLDAAARAILYDMRELQQECIGGHKTETVKFWYRYAGALADCYYFCDEVHRLPEGVHINFSRTIVMNHLGRQTNDTVALQSEDNNFLYIIFYQTGRIRISEEPPD